MDCTEAKPLEFDPELVSQIQENILQEVYKAAKLPKIKLVRDAIKPFFLKSTHRFSELIAGLDRLVKEKGFVAAAEEALCRLTNKAVSTGSEGIPAQGPLVIASNHPGTVDGFAIISQLPRQDFKLVVSGIPFFRNLPNAGKQLIFTDVDTMVRMNVIRQAVRHIQGGGSLLIFPAGRLEPDPGILEGAGKSLHLWSRSIEVFLRKVPQARLVLAITSGILSPEFINHPLTKLFRNDHERRRIMEFMQIIKQMIRGKPINLTPKVSFSKPYLYEEIGGGGKGFIAERAGELLDEHVSHFYPNIVYPKVW